MFGSCLAGWCEGSEGLVIAWVALAELSRAADASRTVVKARIR